MTVTGTLRIGNNFVCLERGLLHKHYLNSNDKVHPDLVDKVIVESGSSLDVEGLLHLIDKHSLKPFKSNLPVHLHDSWGRTQLSSIRLKGNDLFKIDTSELILLLDSGAYQHPLFRNYIIRKLEGL